MGLGRIVERGGRRAYRLRRLGRVLLEVGVARYMRQKRCHGVRCVRLEMDDG